MRKLSTHLFSLLAAALSLWSTPTQAGYTPVAVTGFNNDIVANGTGAAASSTTVDMDGGAVATGRFVFMAPNYVSPTGASPTVFLPATGLISSAATSGLNFQLASYSADNTLRIPATGQAAAGNGVLTLSTPQSAAEVYLLAASGNGASTVTITVTFADATTQVFTAQTVADWFNGTGFAIQGIGRVNRDNDGIENNTTNPRLYQVKLSLLAANYNKLIQSITFNKTSTAGVLNVMGVTLNSACTGTPTGGSTVSSVTNACSSTSIALTLSGASTDVGLSYQWQRSIDNGATWTDISGATSATYTATGQTATTQYRARLTCTSTTLAATSTPVTVTQNPFYNCYCTPVSTGTNEYINSVALNTLSNVTNANSPGGYGDFTTNTALTTTLAQGTSYPLTVGVHANANGSQAGLWIDYDQSGTFDASEYFAIGGSNLTNTDVTLTATLAIPATALLGTTRMRVRWRNSAITGAQACTSGTTTWYGETEDYLVTIVSSTPCTGTPPAGTATASAASTCANTSLMLGVTGIPVGTAGLSYQWQSRPAGSGTFTNLGTAQSTAPYTVTNQTAATDYRVVVTCTASTQSATSSTVTVGQNTFLNCYCTPTGGNCSGEWIRGVSVATLGNVNTTCTSGGYADYTTNAALITTLTPSTTYPVTLDVHVNAASSQAGVWIDYDHSGTFDVSEYTLIGTGPVTGFSNLNTTLTGSLTVPLTALTGLTRMRVRLTNGSLAGAQACANGLSGEVEDYFVTIAAAAPCAGTPNAGSAAASVTTACPGTSFNLSVSGYSAGVTGLTFQWQSSPAGAGTFTNISGATASTYTVANQTAATDYRVTVSCTGGSSANSTPVSVAQTPFMNCYCVPVYANGGATDIISSVTIANMTYNTSTLGNVAPYYHDYSSRQPALLPIPNMLIGGTTNVLVTMGSDFAQYSAVWVDYNRNGIFETTEFYSLNSSAGPNGTATIPVSLPAAAQSGLTKLRIRGGDNAALLSNRACGVSSSDYGEAEDYTVNLVTSLATKAGQADFSLTAYPNPATSTLVVELRGLVAGAQASAALTDVTGRVIKTADVQNQRAAFDLSALPAGLYLVSYRDNEVSKTIKVVKQ